MTSEQQQALYEANRMKALIKQAFREGAETIYANESVQLELIAFLKRNDLYDAAEDEPPAQEPIPDDELPF